MTTTSNKTHPYERVAYVLQGGGALGAYQVGVAEALLENKFEPDWIAGISIGAINAAIIAGNPSEKRLDRLHEFWETIATITPFDEFFRQHKAPFLRGFYNFIGAQCALWFGQHGFFYPRLFNPYFSWANSPDKLSFYDTSPLRNTLQKLVDFDRINSGKIWLSIGAVQVGTGRQIFFNNIKHKICVDHILASAALPPGFPAVEINGEFYWDGGIYSNTPLTVILDALPMKNSLCFMVDCFNPTADNLPRTLDKIREREKDIRYSSHSARLMKLYSLRQNLRASIAYLGTKIPDKINDDPKIQEIIQQGTPKLANIVHLVYQAKTYENYSKDYNFAKVTIEEHMSAGYKDTASILKQANWEKTCPSYCVGALVHSSSPSPEDDPVIYEVPDDLALYLAERE